MSKLYKNIDHIEKAWKFWIGYWSLFGENGFGEKYARAAPEIGLSPRTIKDCQWVASRVQKSLRRDFLSWSHHVLVAKMNEKERGKTLEIAETRGLSIDQLRKYLKRRHDLIS